MDDLKLNDNKKKLANKGKSKVGESLNKYNSLREAADNEMQYKTRVEEKKSNNKKIQDSLTDKVNSSHGIWVPGVIRVRVLSTKNYRTWI